MKKSFILFGPIWFLLISLKGQHIEGGIIDSQTKEPIEYASVGIAGTSLGGISDQHGKFSFQFSSSLSDTVKIKISMIGYENAFYSISEISDLQIVELTRKPINIKEIAIKPMTKSQVGATGYNRSAGWSGWSGQPVRKGYEMGVKIDLGSEMVLVKDLNIMIHRQAFDTSYFRLHMRRINGNEVLEELLTENIIFKLSNESGWEKIMLDKYNIILSGNILLSLEWLDVNELNKGREMKINGQLQKSYFLFKNKKGHDGLYKWGTEAKWTINVENSPSIYLTIME